MPDVLRLRGPSGRPLRIAHLTTVDMSLALLLATELTVDKRAGLDVYGISAPGPYVAQVESLGVSHVPVNSLTRSWDWRADARAARELTSVVRGLRPDILHTHTPKAGVLGRITGRLAGVPVVVNTCHGLWLRSDDHRGKRSIVKGAEGIAARFSHAELFQNAQDARTLRWALLRHDSRVVGNGVDLVRFRFDESGRRRVRAELGLRAGELLVGGVGRRTEEKGLRELSAAAVALAGKARFVWVGPADGGKNAMLPSDFPGVDFLGERFDLPAVYSAYDLFVLPSHREGLSRSAMEAAACGRPMVLSDIRGCREIGRHGEHLLLVAPKDAARLAQTIESLLRDPTLRHRLAHSAQSRARRVFDQNAVAARSLRAYADVARRRGLDWTVEVS